MSDSPAKKLNFEAVGKENIKDASAILDEVETKKPLLAEKATGEKLSTTLSIKAQEADEPLLQENPHRFVLFPIKYHEVC